MVRLRRWFPSPQKYRGPHGPGSCFRKTILTFLGQSGSEVARLVVRRPVKKPLDKS